MTADEFYAKRDLRTAEEVTSDVRLRSTVKISIDDFEACTFAGQLTFLSLANLTARWCRNIEFDAPRVDLHPSLAPAFPGEHLEAAAVACAESVDPFGSFRERTDNDDAAVHVGLVSGDAFPVLGEGWIARGGTSVSSTDRSRNDNLNPCGPSFAACLGASHLLRAVLGHSDLARSACISLWNLEVGNDAVDGPPVYRREAGRVAIIGAGAIGGGMIHLLPFSMLGFEEILLVDADRVEISNLNRVPIFRVQDVGELKVGVAQAYLSRHDLRSTVVEDWYLPQRVDIGNFDVVVPAANEHGFQRRIMENYPPLMIAASTGEDWTAYLQRHIPIAEDCLECRLPSPSDEDPEFACASGDLGAVQLSKVRSIATRTGALPFLSSAGSVMAIAELMKLASGETYPSNANCSSVRFDTQEYTVINSQRKPKGGCPYCPNESVFWQLRSSSRYSHLSRR